MITVFFKEQNCPSYPTIRLRPIVFAVDMGMLRILAIILLVAGLAACDRESVDPEGYEVVYLDINQSCGWNLRLGNNELIWDYHQRRRDGFLHSDINLHDPDRQLQFGDVVHVRFEVLERAPDSYDQPGWLCNQFQGIPVRITEILD